MVEGAEACATDVGVESVKRRRERANSLRQRVDGRTGFRNHFTLDRSQRRSDVSHQLPISRGATNCVAVRTRKHIDGRKLRRQLLGCLLRPLRRGRLNHVRSRVCRIDFFATRRAQLLSNSLAERFDWSDAVRPNRPAFSQRVEEQKRAWNEEQGRRMRCGGRHERHWRQHREGDRAATERNHAVNERAFVVSPFRLIDVELARTHGQTTLRSIPMFQLSARKSGRRQRKWLGR
ncbi:MAG TPA: hypothetical protein VHZ95_15905 [Polyangiales bacterium]|nr:hypothetical protein [Polyangiales bacterium]